MKKSTKFYLTLALVFLLFGVSCGVKIVRPVTINVHKRPGFNLENIQKIAVLEATPGSGEQLGAADIMSLRLLDNGFNVIERAKIKEVLAENKIVIRDDEGLKQAQRIGQILQADTILILSVSEYTQGQQMVPGGACTAARIESVINIGVTARLVDVKNSEIIWVGAATTQDLSKQSSLTRVCDSLISSILGKTYDDPAS